MVEGALDLNFPINDKIGIIGCGHLGRTVAEELIGHGLPREKLMVSYGGSVSTLESIKRAGLIENLSDNETICKESNIIFIAIRPQAFENLRGLTFSRDALVVSCMAGISTASISNALGIDVFRIMPSGPDTIKGRKGITAIYPHNDVLMDILSHIGLKIYELPDEEMMHIFTVGICLPAALLVAEKRGLNAGNAVKIIDKEYRDFEEIYMWARGVLPHFDSNDELERYIEKMSTKGGITEAIVDSLSSGSTLLDALRMGIARSKELSARNLVRDISRSET